MNDEKSWSVIFAADLNAYAFVGVSLSDAKGEYLNNHAVWFTKVCSSQITGICTIVARRRHHRSQREHSRRKKTLHTFIWNAKVVCVHDKTWEV